MTKVSASNGAVAFLRADGTVFGFSRDGEDKSFRELRDVRDICDIINGHLVLTEDGDVFTIGAPDRLQLPKSAPKAQKIRAGTRLAAIQLKTGNWRAFSQEALGDVHQGVVEIVEQLRGVEELSLRGWETGARIAWIDRDEGPSNLHLAKFFDRPDQGGKLDEPEVASAEFEPQTYPMPVPERPKAKGVVAGFYIDGTGLTGDARYVGIHAVPTDLTKPDADIVQLVAFNPHGNADNPAGGVFAIHADGRVTSWGAPSFGLTTIPENVKNVVHLDAGERAIATISADGKLHAWGELPDDFAPDPSATYVDVMVIGGREGIIALRDNGIAHSWIDPTSSSYFKGQALDSKLRKLSGGNHLGIVQLGSGGIRAIFPSSGIESYVSNREFDGASFRYGGINAKAYVWFPGQKFWAFHREPRESRNPERTTVDLKPVDVRVSDSSDSAAAKTTNGAWHLSRQGGDFVEIPPLKNALDIQMADDGRFVLALLPAGHEALAYDGGTLALSGESYAFTTPPNTPKTEIAETKPETKEDPIAKRLSELEKTLRGHLQTRSEDEFRSKLAAMTKQYVGALNRRKTQVSSGGDLDAALALEAEIKRMQPGEEPPPAASDAKLPAAVKPLRASWRKQLRRLESAKKQAQKPVVAAYRKAIEDFQTELTQAQNLAGAVKVRERLTEIDAGQLFASQAVEKPESVGGVIRGIWYENKDGQHRDIPLPEFDPNLRFDKLYVWPGKFWARSTDGRIFFEDGTERWTPGMRNVADIKMHFDNSIIYFNDGTSPQIKNLPNEAWKGQLHARIPEYAQFHSGRCPIGILPDSTVEVWWGAKSLGKDPKLDFSKIRGAVRAASTIRENPESYIGAILTETGEVHAWNRDGWFQIPAEIQGNVIDIDCHYSTLSFLRKDGRVFKTGEQGKEFKEQPLSDRATEILGEHLYRRATDGRWDTTIGGPIAEAIRGIETEVLDIGYYTGVHSQYTAIWIEPAPEPVSTSDSPKKPVNEPGTVAQTLSGFRADPILVPDRRLPDNYTPGKPGKLRGFGTMWPGNQPIDLKNAEGITDFIDVAAAGSSWFALRAGGTLHSSDSAWNLLGGIRRILQVGNGGIIVFRDNGDVEFFGGGSSQPGKNLLVSNGLPLKADEIDQVAVGTNMAGIARRKDGAFIPVGNVLTPQEGDRMLRDFDGVAQFTATRYAVIGAKADGSLVGWIIRNDPEDANKGRSLTQKGGEEGAPVVGLQGAPFGFMGLSEREDILIGNRNLLHVYYERPSDRWDNRALERIAQYWRYPGCEVTLGRTGKFYVQSWKSHTEQLHEHLERELNASDVRISDIAAWGHLDKQLFAAWAVWIEAE